MGKFRSYLIITFNKLNLIVTLSICLIWYFLLKKLKETLIYCVKLSEQIQTMLIFHMNPNLGNCKPLHPIACCFNFNIQFFHTNLNNSCGENTMWLLWYQICRKRRRNRKRNITTKRNNDKIKQNSSFGQQHLLLAFITCTFIMMNSIKKNITILGWVFFILKVLNWHQYYTVQ